MVFCTQCGSQIPGGARFCSSCGTPVAGGSGGGSSSPSVSRSSPSSSPSTNRASFGGSPKPAQKFGGGSSPSSSPSTNRASFGGSPKPAQKFGGGSPSSSPSASRSTSGGTYVSGGLVRSTPPVKAVVSGRASSNTSYAAGLDNSYESGIQKSGYKVTYEKQPEWAFAEQHKNTSGQYKTGQFRHVNL